MSINSAAPAPKDLVIRQLNRRDYESVWHAMQDYTDTRDAESPDEIWLVEHNPVFTIGPNTGFNRPRA